MRTDLTYRQHVQNFDTLLTELREAHQQEDYESCAPLCVDDIITRRVWLTIGGPSVYIDFQVIIDRDSYTPVSATYVHSWGNERQEYQLSEDEMQEAFDLYTLEWRG